MTMGTWLIAAGFVILALFGAPLFTIIGATAMLAFTAQEIDASAVIVELYRIGSNPTLVAIPLFTFAGYMLAESKAPTRLVNLSRAFFGWIPGGLGVVALITCAVFTAFTGASGVTIVALGGLLYPILIHEQYGERFSLGLVTTSGSLGLLFPAEPPADPVCGDREGQCGPALCGRYHPRAHPGDRAGDVWHPAGHREEGAAHCVLVEGSADHHEGGRVGVAASHRRGRRDLLGDVHGHGSRCRDRVLCARRGSVRV